MKLLPQSWKARVIVCASDIVSSQIEIHKNTASPEVCARACLEYLPVINEALESKNWARQSRKRN